jgi:hypothetical protein
MFSAPKRLGLQLGIAQAHWAAPLSRSGPKESQTERLFRFQTRFSQVRLKERPTIAPGQISRQPDQLLNDVTVRLYFISHLVHIFWELWKAQLDTLDLFS